jgi:hypothetical protein
VETLDQVGTSQEEAGMACYQIQVQVLDQVRRLDPKSPEEGGHRRSCWEDRDSEGSLQVPGEGSAPEADRQHEHEPSKPMLAI